MRIAFAAAIAGWGNAHEARIHPVLQIADQNAVLDQNGALGRCAFIINGQRTAAIGQSTIINNGDAGRGNTLANHACKGRGTLAVEVTLKAVTDSFMQQNAGPTGP